MILKYEFTDNKLSKEDAILYPQHLQENIKLEFNKTDESLPNSKYYVDVKTREAVKTIRLKKYNGVYSCELPKGVTNYTFFKLQVHTVNEGRHFTTNELIIPVRCLDYLDYNRAIAHTMPKPPIDACYYDDFKRQFKHIVASYDEKIFDGLDGVDAEFLKFLIEYKFSLEDIAKIFNCEVESVKNKLEEVGVYYNIKIS